MAAEPWDTGLAAELLAAFPHHCQQTLQYRGQPFAWVEWTALIPVLQWLRDHAGFDYLVDITAVDYPDRTERFDLIYVLYSFLRNERIRVQARCPESASPASATSVFPGANWLEREVFDMFGIRFEGHPDLRRMLLPDEWQGHPLRKDYPILGMDNEWVQANLGIPSGQ